MNHLGSVRELLNLADQVVSRFDYDPWGQRSWISGTVDSSFGYAGYLRHAASGLDLTLFRAYDPELGRWLSRDSILESGGLNVYGYVGNSGVNGVDVWGLDPGQHFTSPLDAVINFFEYMDEHYVYSMKNEEWGTTIYSSVGLTGSYFSYVVPYTSHKINSINHPPLYQWWRLRVATCHTHPTSQTAHSGEMDGDKANRRLIDRYIRTADGVYFMIPKYSNNSLPLVQID